MEESAQNLGAGKMSTVRKIEVPLMADRIALMKDGVVQKAGTSVKLYDKPLNRFVADFLGTANFFKKN